jgi:signal recognition particle subunit SRP54
MKLHAISSDASQVTSRAKGTGADSLSIHMFDSLTDRFEGIFGKLRGKGRLSEADIDEVMREIRVALLEADVNVTVARNFVKRVRDSLVGEELSKALNPSQQVIKAVHEELVSTLGGETLQIRFASKPPTVILMAGLQGSGKTTQTAKLARWFKSQGRNPLLVGADLQRPAAVEQLRVLGAQIGVPVFSEASDPVTVAAHGLEEARRLGKDVLIVDTAGRLTIDTELMQQVRDISAAVAPDYTFLVIDAMTGQDAVTTAEAFHAALAIGGGAALSVKEVVGRPIAFAGMGEKLDEFEPFHPDRMAQRILGMGDVMTLIEKAEKTFDDEQSMKAAENMLTGKYSLDDFLGHMRQIRGMGPMQSLVNMVPGLRQQTKGMDFDDRELDRVEAIILSMTKKERLDPEVIDPSRKARISAGSGRPLQEVNGLLKQFKEMKGLMSQVGPMMSGAGGGFGGRVKAARQMSKAIKAGQIDPAAIGLPAGFGGAGPGAPSLGSAARPALPSLPGLGAPPAMGSGGAKKQKGGGRVTPKKGR